MFFLGFSFNIKGINISGIEKKVDTLEYRMIGPGIRYIKFNLPEYPLSAYLLTVDLSNSYNFVETFQALNQTGKTEAMTAAFNRLNTQSHKTIAGVNGNFWIVAGQGQPDELLGVPHSGSAINGEMVTDPNTWNRGHGSIGFALIDKNKKVWIDDIEFMGKVKIPNKGEYPISQINRVRAENELVLYNKYLGVDKVTRTDDNGIEVFIKQVDSSQWTTNEDVKCIVTRIITNKGANLLEDGESVLSGNGTALTYLSNLSLGDTLFVNMSIQTLTDNQFPNVEQMLTGNALVMKNGVLTDRNYNEAYNSQLYPRTGIGSSQDGKTLYLMVIDKKGSSVGASTATMCEILKNFGASDITSMDGGGSAQMMIDGLIESNPSDGKERAVANGFFVYHSAPDDDIVTNIAFDDIRMQFPSLAIYKPKILAYNQYGVLINKDIEGYTLTCSDGLGEITENGELITSANGSTGTLTATYKDATVSKTIKIVAGDMSFRLDSVLLNDKVDYPIEVQSISNNETFDVPPRLLNWTVTDNTVCTIENGVLRGIKNGNTKIIGTIGDSKDSLVVRVEIPESDNFIYDDFVESFNVWKLTASTQLAASKSNNNYPTWWTSGMSVNFTYKSGRAPYIKISNSKPLYSLPDSLSITINSGDISIDRALISVRTNNNKETVSKEFKNFVTDGSDTRITFALNSFFDTSNFAVYPIWFDNIIFYLNAMTENQSYVLAFKDIRLIYNNNSPNKVHLSSESNDYIVYPNPVTETDIQIFFNKPTDKINYKLFNLSGQKMMSQESVIVYANKLTIPSKNLSAGSYFLTITQNQQSKTFKIIKK